MEQTSNKTIFKNTIMLYFRLALVTIVGLYTSRVILQTLGVDDYGIYNVAGSVVAMFGFITGALGQSSSRYITVEIGKAKDNNISDLVRCFKTTRTIHGILAMAIGLICETLGLWILYHSAIPEERMSAAFWVFQISTLTAMVQVTLVPFNALIIAHEKMSIFAYISIFEVTMKLIICYLLIISPIDKLVYYALLMFILQVILIAYYRFYSRRHFEECTFGYSLEKDFFKPIMSFSFWSMFGSLSYSALTQGSTILINMFFGPAIVAARSVANQVKTHVVAFVTNFRMAINPQIIKRDAAGDKQSSKDLLFLSTRVTFYLMLVFVIPLVFGARTVLDFWLVEVPDKATEFLQIVMLEMLFYVYDVTFYQIFQTEGRLKENAIICPAMDLVGLGIVFIYYKLGGNVLAIAWLMVVLTVVQGMIVKPWLAVKLFDYEWADFLKVFRNNAFVLATALVLPLVLWYVLDDSLVSNLIIIFFGIVTSLLSSYYLGFSKEERLKFRSAVLSKIKRNIQ